MRKLIASEIVSLDGYYEGSKGELDWHVGDEEMERYAVDLLNSADAILLGRITYELMAEYWPQLTDGIAPRMNRLPKIVFSQTLNSAHWQNTRLIKGNIEEEVANLKSQPGKDLVVFGSACLVSALITLGLLDELRLIVCPVLLGSGRTLLKDIGDRTPLTLLHSIGHPCGNVTLHYRPEHAAA